MQEQLNQRIRQVSQLKLGERASGILPVQSTTQQTSDIYCNYVLVGVRRGGGVGSGSAETPLLLDSMSPVLLWIQVRAVGKSMV